MNKILYPIFLFLMMLQSAEAAYTPPIATTGASTISRQLADHFSDVKNATDWGVKCDGVALADINISNGAAVLSSISYHFTSADVGKNIVVSSSNETQGLSTTILSVASNNATLAANWTGTTISGNNGRATFYTTDNTTPLQNAINNSATLNTSGYNQTGFKLMIPNGVCATGPITIPRLSILQCVGGPNACELFLKSGSNADLIKSEGFSSLTGTGANYGANPAVPSWYGLQDMHIDGNKIGQSSGRCYSGYGNMQMMLGQVLIENCHDDCIYTEASDGFAYSATDWKSQEEGVFDHVKTRNCGSYGWQDRGPHDKTIIDFIDAESASTGYRSEASNGLYTGSAHIHKMHTYTETDGTGMYFGASVSAEELYPDFANLEFVASGPKVDSIITTSCGTNNLDCVIIDNTSTFFNIGYTNISFASGATGVSGIHIKSGGGGAGTIGPVVGSNINPSGAVTLLKNEASFIVMHDLLLSDVTATNSTCLYLGGSFNVVTGTGFSCYNFIDMTGSGGNQSVMMSYFKAGGTNFVANGGFGVNDTAFISNDAGTGISSLGATTRGTTIYGTQTNNSPAPGYVGEVISSNIASGSAVSLVSGTSKNITSISLTAGDWDVWGTVCFTANALTTATVFEGGINTTTNTLPTAPGAGAYFQESLSVGAGATEPCHAVGVTQQLISSTTPVYLVANSTFSVNTMNAYGFIAARRMR